jgi:hypothetical protein
MVHKLDLKRFLQAMEKSGWSLSYSHGWTAPTTHPNTKQSMEQEWIDSILEAVECPHEEHEHKETLGDA